MSKKKSNRGGKRSGAGRKQKFHGDTVHVILPKEMVDIVINVRDEYLSKVKVDPAYPKQAIFPDVNPVAFTAPLFSSPVPAGFESPANDHIDKRLDLNTHFIDSPSSTFYAKVEGDSMNQAGLYEGSMLLVDKSLEPLHGRVVVATIDGDFTVKRYVERNGKKMLMPESDNPIHQPIGFREGREITIWGVVRSVHHKLC